MVEVLEQRLKQGVAKKPLIGLNLGDGAEGQNRTGDTTIFSRVLYQLSYLAEAAC